MTSTLPHWLNILVANSAISAALCLVAWFASMAMPRRPQIVHWIWWLALLKLATPPVTTIPAPDWWGSPTPSAATLKPDMPTTPDTERRPSPPLIAPATAMEVSSMTAPASTTVAPPAPANAGIPWPFAALSIAILGAIVLFGVTFARVMRFGRSLARMASRAPALEARLVTLSKMGGIRAPRIVWMVDAPIPPFLWGWGRGAAIVIPTAIRDRLDADALDTVLLHEAAHFHRRDHWARLIELTVGAALWWHPLAWIIRRQIRHAEEQCCDAIVTEAIRGRETSYATTLVECVGLLAGARTHLVPGASGFASKSHLKRRIQMIMSGKMQPKLGRLAMLACGAFSALALAVSASAASATMPDAPSSADAETTASDKPDRIVSGIPEDGKRRRAPEAEAGTPVKRKADSELNDEERRQRIRRLEADQRILEDTRDGLIDLQTLVQNQEQRIDLVGGIQQAARIATDGLHRIVGLKNPDFKERRPLVEFFNESYVCAPEGTNAIATRLPSIEATEISRVNDGYKVTYTLTVENLGDAAWPLPMSISISPSWPSRLLKSEADWQTVFLGHQDFPDSHLLTIQAQKNITLDAHSAQTFTYELLIPDKVEEALFTAILWDKGVYGPTSVTITTPLNNATR